MSAEDSAAWCAVIKAGTPALMMLVPALMMLVVGALLGWWMWLERRKED
jgi:uncharacterized iron-regulated membrane protein